MTVRIHRTFWVGVAMFLSVNLAHADEAAGMVKSVKGEVNIVRNGAAIPATPGMKLMAADKVISGPDSAAGVTLQDGTLLSFGAKSVSQLNAFHYDPVKQEGNMLISLLKGSMRFVTGLLGKANPDSVAIRVPSATIGIRGTDFIVSVEGGE